MDASEPHLGRALGGLGWRPGLCPPKGYEQEQQMECPLAANLRAFWLARNSVDQHPKLPTQASWVARRRGGRRD